MIHKNWAELIKPAQLDVRPGAQAARVATVVAEPLERGFGLTLGNALRRVLMSSLQGAAVQSVHIDGVLHEFSSIAGVREDVTDIVLNIKDIAVKMQGEGPKRMVVKKSGPGTVTAGDISTVGDIVARPGGRAFIEALLAEVTAVATAHGKAPDPAYLEATRQLLTAQGSPMTASKARPKASILALGRVSPAAMAWPPNLPIKPGWRVSSSSSASRRCTPGMERPEPLSSVSLLSANATTGR